MLHPDSLSTGIRAVLPLLWKPCSHLAFTGAEKTHFSIFFEIIRSILTASAYCAILLYCGIATNLAFYFRKADRKQTLIFLSWSFLLWIVWYNIQDPVGFPGIKMINIQKSSCTFPLKDKMYIDKPISAWKQTIMVSWNNFSDI